MFDNGILRIPSRAIFTFDKKHMTACGRTYKQSTGIKIGRTLASEGAKSWNSQEREVPSQERRDLLPQLKSAPLGGAAHPPDVRSVKGFG